MCITTGYCIVVYDCETETVQKTHQLNHKQCISVLRELQSHLLCNALLPDMHRIRKTLLTQSLKHCNIFVLHIFYLTISNNFILQVDNLR